MRVKRLLCSLLALCMVLSTMGTVAFANNAEEDVWDGTVDTSWYNDTDTDTEFELTTAEQLAGLAELVNGGNTFEGKTINLGSDLDLSNEVWIPIGTSVYSKEPTDDNIKMFAGNFDGGNYTITGLTSNGYIPNSDETTDGEYSFGLFGCVYGSNISNVNLKDVEIECVARANSDGDDVEGSGVAALVGYYIPVDGKTSVIENCHVISGTVYASNNMGGLIGFVDSKLRMPEVDITIKDCSNAADVTTDAREAGGILGLIRSSRTDIEHISMRGNILFKNCKNSGDITSLGSGNPSVGGILGRDGNEDSWAKLNMVFDGCRNTGKITVYANYETHAAGIAAGHYSNGAWFVIKNSSNTGEVVVINPENASDVYAGGLISYGGVVELLNSTSSKAVKLGDTNGNTYIGDVANILFIDEMYGYADTVNGCTYFLNGGDAPDERKYLTDNSGNYNFYPVETASKDGFEFGYWYDNPEFTGNVYDATTSIRNGSAKVFYAKWIGPVAKIGSVEYQSIEDAFAAAHDGETITLLTNVAPVLKSQRAITKASVIDLDGNKITLTEDDLYFGTTTFKNGDIVVAPVVKPSTAVFWMFKDQTLTFDNVKLTATGVTGTYLIGLDGNNSDLNLLNGSEIIVENDTALDLDIICVNASEGNDIVIDNSKVNVTNLDGRVFFRGNYTVSGNSDIDLEGITKAGFRIEKGQTLNIADTATVDIVGEPRDGGIHIVELPATYSKADTATVNATVNVPASEAKIKDTEYATLKSALEAANDGDVITLLLDVADEAFTVDKSVTIQSNTKVRSASKKTLNNVKFTMASGVEFTVKDLKFTGDSYINANEGAALTVTNCEADVDPAKIAGRSAFIVTGTAEPNNIPLKLVVTDNVILSAKSAGDYYGTAIFGWRYLADGTTISGNTFGSETDRYNYVVVKTMNAMPDAKFVIENNKVYGTNKDYHFAAFDLYQNCSRDNAYTVVSKDNDIIVDLANDSNKACAFRLEGDGGTNVVVLENGSTLNDKKVGFEDFETSSLPSNYNKFYGIDVELDENGKIIAGKLTSIPDDSYLADGYVATLNPVSNIYEVSGENLVANEISVVFEEVASGSEDEKLFNINLVATSDINEFASAEFTFVNTSTLNDGSVMPYVITAAKNMTLTNPEKGYYGFAMDGANKYQISGNKITIGQVRFTGYGDIDFNVASGIVNATTVLNNLVKTYTTNGAVSGDITKGDLVINTGVIDTIIAVPTRTLKVNVEFPNAVVDNAAAYQAMKVEITGVIEGKNQTVTYDLGGNMKTDGKYVVTEDRLVLNNAYTVTVSGAGYRTARYTVTMTTDKTLRFWNNVMDENQVVELGKDSSIAKVTFLAGDIVKDNNINIYDLSAVVSYFGTQTVENGNILEAKYAKYDLNRDGVIDSKDVAYVLVSWNN